MRQIVALGMGSDSIELPHSTGRNFLVRSVLQANPAALATEDAESHREKHAVICSNVFGLRNDYED
jgi:hypothetical protein